MTDLQKALLDPTSEFDSPGDVLKDESTSREQKIEILRRWEYDARELQVASEENMPGNNSDILDEVLDALNKLGALEVDHSEAPTKQGGV